jgi:2-hydroxychromene-2-carboxylate isomerase
MIAREVEIYAEAQGLTLLDYYREADATAVHLGWLFLREFSGEWLEAYLRTVFRSYWAGDLAPEDVESVALIVEGVGGDATDFRNWAEEEGPGALAEIATDLAARGITAVPGYLVQGEFFQGRQHLPMIGWILDGRSGPGPI